MKTNSRDGCRRLLLLLLLLLLLVLVLVLLLLLLLLLPLLPLLLLMGWWRHCWRCDWWIGCSGYVVGTQGLWSIRIKLGFQYRWMLIIVDRLCRQIGRRWWLVIDLLCRRLNRGGGRRIRMIDRLLRICCWRIGLLECGLWRCWLNEWLIDLLLNWRGWIKGLCWWWW